MEINNIISEIDAISNGNSEAKKKLIDIIINQTTSEIIKLNINLHNENWAELKKSAHKMKSTFIYLKQPYLIELTDFLRKDSGNDVVMTKKNATEFTNQCKLLIDFLKLTYP